MISGEELAGWCRSRDRQRVTQREINAFAESWNDGAVNRRFAAAMATLPAPTAEAVISAISALFADDEWAASLVGSVAEAMRGDPFFEPPFRHLNSDIHQGLVAFEDDHVSLAIGVTDAARLAARKTSKRGRTSIAFSGQVDILKFVKAGGARLGFWAAPPILPSFTAADAGRCEPVGSRIMEDGEILVLDGRSQSFVIEHARSNLVVLQATVKHERAPLAVEYDSETREYVGCSAADDSASRVLMISTLLRKLDCAAAFPAIALFLDDPSFFVRWHVMRELLGLDAEAALPHLRRMAARDHHPETRRAARELLDRIEHGQLLTRAA